MMRHLPNGPVRQFQFNFVISHAENSSLGFDSARHLYHYFGTRLNRTGRSSGDRRNFLQADGGSNANRGKLRVTYPRHKRAPTLKVASTKRTWPDCSGSPLVRINSLARQPHGIGAEGS
jgi:hypothetical protein